MNIVLAGCTGFIGASLAQKLSEEGHSLILLARDSEKARGRAPRGTRVEEWDGASQGPLMAAVNGADAIINLAGAPVAQRWTSAHKRRIRESRLGSTKALVAAIAAVKVKPKTLLNASGVGYYGDGADAELSEETPAGRGFLAEVCRDWEVEAARAEASGVRVVSLRIGVVLEKDGGALAKMLPPFYLFAGGPPGSGRQYFSWIHRDDVVGVALRALSDPAIRGPVNVTAPEPPMMKEFCAALGRALGRPSWAPVPSFVLRLALGEMAEMLLTGQRAAPKKLADSGFRFKYPSLDGALSAILSER